MITQTAVVELGLGSEHVTLIFELLNSNKVNVAPGGETLTHHEKVQLSEEECDFFPLLELKHWEMSELIKKEKQKRQKQKKTLKSPNE